jgi:hypothetical protein
MTQSACEVQASAVSSRNFLHSPDLITRVFQANSTCSLWRQETGRKRPAHNQECASKGSEHSSPLDIAPRDLPLVDSQHGFSMFEKLDVKNRSANCPRSLRAVSGSPGFDGWWRHALCGRCRYSDLKEAALRSLLYIFSIGLRWVIWIVGWCCGLRGSVATLGHAEMGGLEAAVDGGWGGFVGATGSMRRGGGVHGEAGGEIEAGVAGSCGT